jgi:hypothetical protein
MITRKDYFLVYAPAKWRQWDSLSRVRILQAYYQLQ